MFAPYKRKAVGTGKMNIFDEAKRWVDAGIAVFPCVDKAPAIKAWKPYQTSLPNAQDLYLWFSGGRFKNLAVVTGWNNLIVLDFDDLNAFFTWWPEVNNLMTYMVLTGRGIHVYFFCEDLPHSQNFQGGNLQARGKYVIGVPSVHPSGAVYQVMCNEPIMRVRGLDEILPAHYRTHSENETKNLPTVPSPVPNSPRIMTDPWEAAGAPQSKNNLVATIKDRYPILSFFPNAKPTKDGWYMARCPFHDDHDPSMWIDTKHGFCGCYAGCTPKPLDAINFYARVNKINDRQAIDALGNLLRKG